MHEHKDTAILKGLLSFGAFQEAGRGGSRKPRIWWSVAFWLTAATSAGFSAEPSDIGDRLELFVDEHLIEQLGGDAELRLHRPVMQEVVMVTDAPWEGNKCHFRSVFQDGDLYRMYYGCYHARDGGDATKALAAHGPVLCYAESNDGVHWTKPQLRLVEFGGSKANNIVLDNDSIAGVQMDIGHVAVGKDANPNCRPDAKYKAIVRSAVKPLGLYALKSPDGLHWSALSEDRIITQGAFDSQNLAFWDSVRHEYREYHRGFRDGVRDILTGTSKDFLHWTEPVWLNYPGAAKEHLYTNQIAPYYRAPHIFVGFPMRYQDRGWSPSMEALPRLVERKARSSRSPRYGTAITDGLFMTSRDGLHFKRWGEAYIRPGLERKDTWVYGDNSTAWGIVETKSALRSPNELSIYTTEGYWTGVSLSVRRYSLRIDGFVSLNAPLSGGEAVTKPIKFAGGELVLNFSTSAAGSVRVEIQDAAGKPLEGYSLADCPEMFGDELERVVRWKGGSDVGSLAGQAVRLRLVVQDADLFSFRFR